MIDAESKKNYKLSTRYTSEDKGVWRYCNDEDYKSIILKPVKSVILKLTCERDVITIKLLSSNLNKTELMNEYFYKGST